MCLCLQGSVFHLLPVHSDDARPGLRLQSQSSRPSVHQMRTPALHVRPVLHGPEESEQRGPRDTGRHVKQMNQAVVRTGAGSRQQILTQIRLKHGDHQHKLLLLHHRPALRNGPIQRREEMIRQTLLFRASVIAGLVIVRLLCLWCGRPVIRLQIVCSGEKRQLTAVGPQRRQADQRAHEEAKRADETELLALDVDVGDEAPGDGEEGEQTDAGRQTDGDQVQVRDQTLTEYKPATHQQIFTPHLRLSREKTKHKYTNTE